ncbi:MAG: PAS domain S-box protein, partial [Geobacteraceae bacterium]|nr:PAS domain S-box protein [Geobacteraceae bacterium]
MKPHPVRQVTGCTSDGAAPCPDIDAMRFLQHELEMQIEELRSTNLELEASRNKYALLYDSAPVGYFTFGRDGSILSVNLTGATLLRNDRSALANKRFELFVAAEDRFMFVDFLRMVFLGRDKMTCRVRLSINNQPPLHVRIEAMAAGIGEECHAAMVDITERHQWEEYLRDSEYNLSKAQSMSHVGSWRSDPLTGELRVSDELLRIMNLSREETTPEMLTSVVHPEDREAVLARLRQGAEQGTSYEIEHRLQLRDGTSKWVYSIVEPSVNIARQVVKLYGTTQDITERKHDEVRLRNKKNELQAIFDAVNDGVIVFDHAGSVQHYNHICPQFFPEDVLSGARCKDLFHPDADCSPQICPVELALKGEGVETSMVSAREGHNTRYIDITANPIEDELGEKTRALLFFRDVTQKRVHEMQLIQTEKMSTLGYISAGMAHEIRNPLNSIGLYVQLLKGGLDDPERFEFLEKIEMEVRRIDGILRKLMDAVKRPRYHLQQV